MSEFSPTLHVEPLNKTDSLRLINLFVPPEGGRSLLKMRRYVNEMLKNPLPVYTIRISDHDYDGVSVAIGKAETTVGIMIIASTQYQADNSSPFLIPEDYLPKLKRKEDELLDANLELPLLNLREIYEDGHDADGTPLPPRRYGAVGSLACQQFKFEAVS